MYEHVFYVILAYASDGCVIKIATESGSQCISRYYIIIVLFLFNNLHESVQFPVLIHTIIQFRNLNHDAITRKYIKSMTKYP